MEEHSVYVYNNIVKKNENIKEIYIVAHSMGGSCTVDILLSNKEYPKSKSNRINR